MRAHLALRRRLRHRARRQRGDPRPHRARPAQRDVGDGGGAEFRAARRPLLAALNEWRPARRDRPACHADGAVQAADGGLSRRWATAHFFRSPRRCGSRMQQRLDIACARRARSTRSSRLLRSVRPRRRISSTGISTCICFRRCATPCSMATRRLAPSAWVRQCGSALPLHRRAHRSEGVAARLAQPRVSRARGRALASPPIRPSRAPIRIAPNADFAAHFPDFLDGMPEGGLIMCHPGFVDAELERLDPLTTLREREYAYFCTDGSPQTLKAHDLTLN